MTLALLFDIDGTLMDTFELILPSMNEAVEAFGVKPVTSTELRPMIGQPVERQLDVLRGVTGPVVGQITDLYYERFSARVDAGVRLFPGVAETLRTLSDRPIGTMSTRRRAEARHMLHVTGIEPFFTAVVGGDDAPRPKPYPDLPRLGAASLGRPPEQCVVVGDAPVDILAGRAARAWTVAVTYGYGNPKALQEAKPHATISRFEELPSVLEDLDRRGP